jgi:hypothetical protein
LHAWKIHFPFDEVQVTVHKKKAKKHSTLIQYVKWTMFQSTHQLISWLRRAPVQLEPLMIETENPFMSSLSDCPCIVPKDVSEQIQTRERRCNAEDEGWVEAAI